MPILPPLLSMAMNADLLAHDSNIFYLSATTGERLPATVVGLLSLPECVAISHEHSGHTQLYRDCPMQRLAFPIVHVDSPASAALAADIQECAETLDIAIHFQSPQTVVTVFYCEQLQSLCHRVKKWCSKLVIDTSASVRGAHGAHGAGAWCAEAPIQRRQMTCFGCLPHLNVGPVAYAKTTFSMRGVDLWLTRTGVSPGAWISTRLEDQTQGLLKVYPPPPLEIPPPLAISPLRGRCGAFTKWAAVLPHLVHTPWCGHSSGS